MLKDELVRSSLIFGYMTVAQLSAGCLYVAAHLAAHRSRYVMMREYATERGRAFR